MDLGSGYFGKKVEKEKRTRQRPKMKTEEREREREIENDGGEVSDKRETRERNGERDRE